ncbi:MAG: HPr family phosphocarrier protein [Collinsella sp.]
MTSLPSTVATCRLRIGDRHTDGRDVMGLMALYGECGEDIIFRVSGVDEASCVTSIRNLSL